MTIKNNKGELLGFFAHISRMYNSAINALTSIIFGWVAFFGIAFNLNMNLILFVPISGIIMLMAGYIFYRILLFGRWICQIENDLQLGEYITCLYRSVRIPKIDDLFDRIKLKGISVRPNRVPEKWTKGEIISGLFLTVLFAVPFFYYILR